MDRQQLLNRIETAWNAFSQSYAGLSDAALTEPGVAGEWSVKDLLSHVATWEEEALKAMPLVLAGKLRPRYGDIDRFNAQQSALKGSLTLAEAHQEFAETHQRLLTYLESVPDSAFAGETRFRRKLRLDTYGHYPEHTEAILTWRKANGL